MGWKRHIVIELLNRSGGFKSHHSGMETSYQMWGHAEQDGFKSHHSGMETSPGPILDMGLWSWSFKSHHSGMETCLRTTRFKTRWITLNRTIVGWKHIFALQSTFTNQALNRTIVGWKHLRL